MKALEEKIRREGEIISENILKVGSFLNQQLDPAFMFEMGVEIARLFQDAGVTKVLTIEASGIALALAAAFHMGIPAVFAKKSKSNNMSQETLSVPVKSFTRGTTYDVSVSKEYLVAEDKVLLVDDFLASGNALEGLLALTEQAGASVVGAAIAIEKGFQHGGDRLRAQGIRVESLSIIEEMSQAGIRFRGESI